MRENITTFYEFWHVEHNVAIFRIISILKMEAAGSLEPLAGVYHTAASSQKIMFTISAVTDSNVERTKQYLYHITY